MIQLPEIVKREYHGLELTAETPAAQLFTGIHQKTKETHCIKLCLDQRAAKNIPIRIFQMSIRGKV
jgi:hypothetical protein